MKATALRHLRDVLEMVERASNDPSKTDFASQGPLWWPIVIGSVRYSVASALNELGAASALRQLNEKINEQLKRNTGGK